MLRIALIALALSGCITIDRVVFIDDGEPNPTYDQCVEDCTDVTQEKFDCEANCRKAYED